MDVYHLVDFFFLLFHLFVGTCINDRARYIYIYFFEVEIFFIFTRTPKRTQTYKMEDLQAIDEVVDLPHETFHEDHLRQADAHVLELGGEGLHLREIVQLHGGREIEQHVRQVRTLVR